MNILQKLDSAEKWAAFYREYSLQDLGVYQDLSLDWWANREAARSVLTYRVSAELGSFNKRHPGLYAHISTHQPEMIAFTPDRTSGLADRQIVMAPGRFFNRFLPHLSENTVRGIAENHIAEACVHLEFIEGKAIAHMYTSLPKGLRACMSNSNWSQWSHTHPANAYDAPGIKLALMRNGRDEIIGRSLVYEPSETDKRYIRIYGVPSMKQLLQAAGYSAGNLVGAKLKAVLLESGQVVVPYLDGNDSAADANYSSVALWDGSLKVLTAEERRVLGSKTFVAQSTYGCAPLQPVIKL